MRRAIMAATATAALLITACQADDEHEDPLCSVEYFTEPAMYLPDPILTVRVTDDHFPYAEEWETPEIADCFGSPEFGSAQCAFTCAPEVDAVRLQWPLQLAPVHIACWESIAEIDPEHPEAVPRILVECDVGEPDPCGENYACEGNNLCIPWDYFCDGFEDCPNAEDEECGGG